MEFVKPGRFPRLNGGLTKIKLESTQWQNQYSRHGPRIGDEPVAASLQDRSNRCLIANDVLTRIFWERTSREAPGPKPLHRQMSELAHLYY